MTTEEKRLNTAFLIMGSMLEKWKSNDPSIDRRYITRCYYEVVGKKSTGWVSREARKDNAKTTDDHFATPQWIGRFIMDEGDIYLKDFAKFREITEFASQTIKVTKRENTELAKQSSVISEIDGKNVFIETSLQDKYQEAKIFPLYHKKNGIGYVYEFPIDFPPELLEYERKFLREEKSLQNA